MLTFIQAFLPLLGVPGYEAAEVQTILFAFASGHLAISWFHRSRPAASSVIAGAANASIRVFALLALTTLLLTASGYIEGVCDWGYSMMWFALLPATTIFLGVAWGTLVSVTMGTKARAHILFAFIVLGHLFLELFIIWRLPVTFVYNSLLGYFPGPVYDRAVPVSIPLIASRAEALALTFALLSLSQIIAKARNNGARLRPSVTALEAQLLVASLLVWSILTFEADSLGTFTGRKTIESTLGGRFVGKNVTIYYPEDLTEQELRLLALDVEFRFQEQSRFLGLENPPPVSAYFYRGEAEKKFLMGAGATEYADCAKREMHVNIDSPPIPVLKHEIVHVLAAPWGISGLGFSAVLGVTEGLAVASEVWRYDFTITQWAAAMKAVGRLPKISRTAGPTGFWTLSGARSYLAWGGFVTWLIENFGMDAVHRVYATGDFKKSFGKSIEDLEREWEASLDDVALPQKLLRQAAYTFFRKSLFEGRCARAVGRIAEGGEEAMSQSRFRKASRLFETAADFSGGESGDVGELMNALYRARLYDNAWARAQEIIDNEGAGLNEPPSPGKVVTGNLAAAVRALATQARIAWLRNDTDEAVRLYEKVWEADVIPSLRREAVIALSAFRCGEPTLSDAMRKYFVDPDASYARDFYLLRAIDSAPRMGVLHYLLGQRLLRASQYEDAAREMSDALDLTLPDEIQAKAFFDLGQTLYEAGRYEEAVMVFTNRRPDELSRGDSLEADEWVVRCLFASQYEASRKGPWKGAEGGR